jgi:hypothetical protein
LGDKGKHRSSNRCQWGVQSKSKYKENDAYGDSSRIRSCHKDSSENVAKFNRKIIKIKTYTLPAWVWNLASHIKERTQAKSVRKQGAEYIWT